MRADVLVRVCPERVPRPAVAPAALDAAVEHGAVRDRVVLVREIGVAPPLRLVGACVSQELERRNRAARPRRRTLNARLVKPN